MAIKTLGTSMLPLFPQKLEGTGTSKFQNLHLHSFTRKIGSTKPTSYNAKVLSVPVIDLEDFAGGRRGEIVEEIGKAFETWGIFYVVNHGIPINVMKTLLESIREFHEQPEEMKMELYKRDYYNKSMEFNGRSPDLFRKRTQHWRESLSWEFEDDKFDADGVPLLFRKAVEDYMKCLVKFIKNVFSDLSSEALGLGSQHLASMGCFESQTLGCNYYPPCPDPHLAQGKGVHTDPYMLTVGLQDNIAARQIFHENNWLEVAPVEGSLDINAGDLLQLITNGKFKSPVHKVIAQKVGPRVAAACFFQPSKKNEHKPYGAMEKVVTGREINTLQHLES